MPGAPQVLTTTDVPRHCPVSPAGQNHPWLRLTALQNWLLAHLSAPPLRTYPRLGRPTNACVPGWASPPVTARLREIGLTWRSSPRLSVMPSEGQRIDLHVAKKLNDIPFCYLKRCLSNSVMEQPDLGPGAPGQQQPLQTGCRTRDCGRGPVFPQGN